VRVDCAKIWLNLGSEEYEGAWTKRDIFESEYQISSRPHLQYNFATFEHIT
jgi:hypothetical protein